MSDTPKTDALADKCRFFPVATERSNVIWDHARQLERELARLRAQVEAARTVIERGVDLVGDRLGEWEGVRAWLEQPASDYLTERQIRDDEATACMQACQDEVPRAVAHDPEEQKYADVLTKIYSYMASLLTAAIERRIAGRK